MSECVHSNVPHSRLYPFSAPSVKSRGRSKNTRNRRWWSRLFHAKYDKEKVQGWKSDFHKTLDIFNVSYTTQSTWQVILRDPPDGVKCKRCVHSL